MNNVKGSSTAPIWYGAYDVNALTLITCVKNTGTGTLLDNSQTAYQIVNGVVVFPYSSIIRTSKAAFEAELAAMNITNPDELEIPD